MRMTLRGFLAIITVIVMTACANQNHQPTRDTAVPLDNQSSVNPSTDVLVLGSDGRRYTHVFPRPPALEPQIQFWRNVYARWNIDQVALHDDRYMDLVYAVVDLPGTVHDGRYTSEQRHFIQARREYLQEQLAIMERKTVDGLPLTDREQRLAALISASSGGKNAIFGASERLRHQRGLRQRFRRGLEISGRYDALFREIFRTSGLPEDLAYLPHVESSFQAHARSSAGATGMWQFTRGAARTYMNTHPTLDERLDPVASARGAARYLRDAYDRLGDWSLALTSYNHGIGGMSRAKKQFGTDFMGIVRYYDGRHFGFASRNFYAEFLAARDIAKQPEYFFPEGLSFQPPLDQDRIVLLHPTTVADLARLYGVERQWLHTLNPAWTAVAHSGRMALPAGTEVWLPPGTLTGTTQANDLSEQALAMDDNIRTGRFE